MQVSPVEEPTDGVVGGSQEFAVPAPPPVASLAAPSSNLHLSREDEAFESDSPGGQTDTPEAPLTPDRLSGPAGLESQNGAGAGGSGPKSVPGPRLGIIRRIRQLLVHNILRLDDTPSRIALGVFLGTVIGFAPIMGLQMVVLFAAATLLRANKVSGIPVVWITNPITAVPFYYGCWLFGRFVLSGQIGDSSDQFQRIASLIQGPPGEAALQHFYTQQFWSSALSIFLEVGLELWVGSLTLGVLFGALFYWLTYRAVVAFRRHRHAHESEQNASPR